VGRSRQWIGSSSGEDKGKEKKGIGEGGEVRGAEFQADPAGEGSDTG
jgi:hypothetical protein